MTTLTDNTIDELIKRVKAQPGLECFLFASAYPPRDAPYPVGRYYVTVENSGVKRTQLFIGSAVGEGKKGAVYEVKLKARVYAPCKSSGSALLRASSVLADAFERADVCRWLRELSLGGINYDGVTRTQYRDLFLTLSTVLFEEAEDV